MDIINYILLAILLVCAISVSFSKSLLNSIIIYMAFSLIMSIIWIILESPDLAITEAAVGTGISGTLFLMTLKKISAEDAGEVPDEETGTKIKERSPFKNGWTEALIPISEIWR